MKSSPTIVLPGWMATEIATVAQEHNETRGASSLPDEPVAEAVCAFSVESCTGYPTLAYDRRTTRALSIRSAGYVDALARADERGDVPIWIHTHPGWDADPRRSKYDRIVDGELHETFRIRSGAAGPRPWCSLPPTRGSPSRESCGETRTRKPSGDSSLSEIAGP